jgi:methylated-DNA-[protein]-cysteine S-methyltransferase
MSIALRDLETPIGVVTLAASEEGLSHCLWSGSPRLPADGGTGSLTPRRHLDAAARALSEYFGGSRRDFSDLELAPRGTSFQLDVWSALQAIPFGSTISYRELARGVGRPRAARAVGMANHHNPLVVIVP